MTKETHYLSFGKGKKSLVFLHGWQQSGKCFTPLIPHLYHKYKIYLLDMPGFGKTPYRSGLNNSYDYAEFITLWLKTKRICNIVLVGHSFGGKIASIIAADNPSLIKGLILISTSGIPHPRFYYPFLPFLKRFPMLNIFKRFLISHDYKEAGKLLPVFKEVVKEDLKKDFSRIKTPTLIIWGDGDNELPSADAFLISSLIKSSSVKIIRNTAHFPFIEKPQKVASLIDEFFSNL